METPIGEPPIRAAIPSREKPREVFHSSSLASASPASAASCRAALASPIVTMVEDRLVSERRPFVGDRAMSSQTEAAGAASMPAGDEEWKERVQAENRALDETVRQEAAAANAAGQTTDAGMPHGAAEESEQKPLPIPEADFVTLVTMFSTQALVALGAVPHPATGKPHKNRELAKHFIDLLGVVEEKTRGNLDAAERKLVDVTLHDLRMMFVRMG